MKTLTVILMIVAILVMIWAGTQDATGRRFFFTKEHLWFVGIFILLLAVLVEVAPTTYVK